MVALSLSEVSARAVGVQVVECDSVHTRGLHSQRSECQQLGRVSLFYIYILRQTSDRVLGERREGQLLGDLSSDHSNFRRNIIQVRPNVNDVSDELDNFLVSILGGAGQVQSLSLKLLIALKLK